MFIQLLNLLERYYVDLRLPAKELCAVLYREMAFTVTHIWYYT
jgi:hypothetical protein